MTRQPSEGKPSGITRAIVMEAEITRIEGQLKLGQSRGYTMLCDEPSYMGGTGSAPPSMAFLVASVGF